MQKNYFTPATPQKLNLWYLAKQIKTFAFLVIHTNKTKPAHHVLWSKSFSVLSTEELNEQRQAFNGKILNLCIFIAELKETKSKKKKRVLWSRVEMKMRPIM